MLNTLCRILQGNDASGDHETGSVCAFDSESVCWASVCSRARRWAMGSKLWNKLRRIMHGNGARGDSQPVNIWVSDSESGETATIWASDSESAEEEIPNIWASDSENEEEVLQQAADNQPRRSNDSTDSDYDGCDEDG